MRVFSLLVVKKKSSHKTDEQKGGRRTRVAVGCVRRRCPPSPRQLLEVRHGDGVGDGLHERHHLTGAVGVALGEALGLLDDGEHGAKDVDQVRASDATLRVGIHQAEGDVDASRASA